MKTKKTILIVSIISFSSILFLNPASAQNNVRRTQTKEEVKENREITLQKRCEKAKATIENRLELKTKGHDKRDKALGNIEKGLTSAIKKAKELGLDTSKVEKDIQDLIALRRKLADAHSRGALAYQYIKEIQCGERTGEIGEMLKNALEEDKEYKKATKEELKKALETLKTDLKALKDQVRELRNNKKN